ncbi:MAG: hypothetical protein ACTSPQ_06520 [Candidatus Helarchaeota archaeon]
MFCTREDQYCKRLDFWRYNISCNWDSVACKLVKYGFLLAFRTFGIYFPSNQLVYVI